MTHVRKQKNWAPQSSYDFKRIQLKDNLDITAGKHEFKVTILNKYMDLQEQTESRGKQDISAEKRKLLEYRNA